MKNKKAKKFIKNEKQKTREKKKKAKENTIILVAILKLKGKKGKQSNLGEAVCGFYSSFSSNGK